MWGAAFFIVVALAALVGFTGEMGPGHYVARILFFTFLVLFIITLFY